MYGVENCNNGNFVEYGRVNVSFTACFKNVARVVLAGIISALMCWGMMRFVKPSSAMIGLIMIPSLAYVITESPKIILYSVLGYVRASWLAIVVELVIGYPEIVMLVTLPLTIRGVFVPLAKLDNPEFRFNDCWVTSQQALKGNRAEFIVTWAGFIIMSYYAGLEIFLAVQPVFVVIQVLQYLDWTWRRDT